MAQLQFRSDDTITWEEGFGSGSLGSATISSNTNLFGGYAFTGTGSTKAGSVTAGDEANFNIGDIVTIHQTIKNPQDTPNWQFNVVTGKSSGSLQFKYDLTQTYSSGAQVVKATEYSTLSIASGFDLSVPSVYDSDGNGGIGVVFVKNLLSIAGNLDGEGLGFKGYALSSPADELLTGKQGGGYPHVGGNRNKLANGNGGGAGEGGNSGGAGGGAGGGNGTAGANGSAANFAGGTGGGTAGNAALTQLSLGGGSGSGGSTANRGQNGKSGGAALIIVAREIEVTGLINANGLDGDGGATSGGASGGAAGGSVLIKCVDADIGADRIRTAGGASAVCTGAGGNSGAGGKGRINIDYSGSLTGSVGATYYGSYNTRNDATIVPAPDVLSSTFYFM